MSGITEGGGREMDGDTGGGGEDRRRGVPTLVSIEFLVTNGLRGALQARQQSQQNTALKILIIRTHACKHTRTHTGRQRHVVGLKYIFFSNSEFPVSESFAATPCSNNPVLINATHQWTLIIKTD